MSKRRSMSTRRRLRIFESSNGVCCLCRGKIHVGEKWTVEHIKALGLCGEDEDGNCGPAHERCRRLKDKDDISRMAKADRAAKKHLGLKESKNPLPGGRWSKWKKKLSGEVVER